MKSLTEQKEEVTMIIDFSRAVSLLHDNDNFIILTHANPDGDTLGAGFALLCALRKLGKKARLVSNDPIPEKYRFLVSEGDDFEDGFVLSVDVADAVLLGKDVQSRYGAEVSLAIDHHSTNRLFAKESYVEGESASVCEVVYLLIKALGVEIDSSIATRLYTGCSTDTGCFRYTNVTPRTHRIAAELIEHGARHGEVNVRMFETKKPGFLKLQGLCISSLEMYFAGRVCVITVTQKMLRDCGCGEEDCDAIVALSRQIEGVQAGITFKEKKDGTYKVSVRTHESLDAAQFCSAFGGGGHARAAGCQFDCMLDEAKRRVIHEMEKYF